MFFFFSSRRRHTRFDCDWSSDVCSSDLLALYTNRWRDELADVKTTDLMTFAYDEALAESFLDRTLHTDQVTYLAGDLLPKTDRTTMAHSVEARTPFLDGDLVGWAARLPERYQGRGLRTKWAF